MVQCLGFCIFFLFRVYKGVFLLFFSRQKEEEEEEEEEEDLFGVISQSAFLVEPFDVLLCSTL